MPRSVHDKGAALQAVRRNCRLSRLKMRRQGEQAAVTSFELPPFCLSSHCRNLAALFTANLCIHPACAQVWDGYCCPENAECSRGNQFYYQCLPKPGSSSATSNAPSSAATGSDEPNTPRKLARDRVNIVRIADQFAPQPAAVAPAPPHDPIPARTKGGQCTAGTRLQAEC